MIIQKLRVAIKEGYQIRLINYHSLNSDMIKNRLIIPLKLSSDFAMLSAVEEGKEKTFKIKRMTDVEILYEEKAGIGEAMNVDIFGCSSTEALPIQLYLSKRAFQLFYEEYPSARMYLNKRKNFTVFPYELRLEVQNYAGIGRWCLGLIGELKVVGDEGFRVYLNEKLKAGGEY
ncbi:MAG: hypothetical protein U5N85_14645 [Arcicella sp.]|nr:hypothetical protein [Arcicella sp.]